MRTIVIMAALCAVAGCKKNPAYCAVDGDCASHSCMLPAHECAVAPPGSDLASMSTDMATGCVQACGGATPICVAPSCQACTVQSDPDAACAALNGSATPHCLTSGADAGSCVGCIDASQCTDPMKPFCDTMTTHACRRCLGSSDCPLSLVCDRIPTSGTFGRCIDAGDVAYVDGSAASNGNALTPATPAQKINDGVNKALAATRHYLHVAPGTYSEYVALINKTMIVVGEPGTIVSGPNNMDAFGVSQTGSLTIVGVEAVASSGNGGNCLNAQNAGTRAAAYFCNFHNATNNGVYSAGAAITLDGCYIHDNPTGVSTDSNFTIINTILTHNGAGSGAFLQRAGATTAIFINNTVADNTAAIPIAGVTCATPNAFSVANSILFNNVGSSSTETSCATNTVASDDPTNGPTSAVPLSMGAGKLPGFVGGVPLDYHLTASSPCRGKGAQLGITHDLDLQPRPDPTSGLVDIGADQFYP